MRCSTDMPTGPRTVRGLPDRIDLFSNEGKDAGLWIIDYKASTTPYTGKVMLEKKLKLQLPFYAIAAQKQLKQKVLGVQFITLNESADLHILAPVEETQLRHARDLEPDLLSQDAMLGQIQREFCDVALNACRSAWG